MPSILNANLFLIPNILSAENSADFIPEDVRKKVHHVRQFIVEQEKSARALINKLKLETPQSELDLRLWNEHSVHADLADTIDLFQHGDVGLISEAGIPCVADPGADIVAWAHRNGVRVIPLPGSSSLFMALMSSGLNGQSFTFHGYLPIDKPKRQLKIKEMGIDAVKKKQSQLFMEAPYRNNAMFEDLIKFAEPFLKLCIACHIGSSEEMIQTKTIKEWRLLKPELHKKPVIFILG